MKKQRDENESSTNIEIEIETNCRVSSDATESGKVVGREGGVGKGRHADGTALHRSEYLDLSHVSVASVLMI